MRVDPAGDVVWSVGDPQTVIFPRSANKPIQALGMLRAGLPLQAELLALATASHSAEPFHLDGVRQILAQAGLDETALQTPASYPVEPRVHAQILREHGQRERIYMDCSGKHAAMLLTCQVNGWPTSNYLEREHPLQRCIEQTFTDLTGAPADVVGVDGCGAPLLATQMRRLAHAIGQIAGAEPHTMAGRLADAMRKHPEYVSGTQRAERAVFDAVPGVMVKSGAESVYVAGLPDGSGIALKIEDGSERPLYAVMNRALEVAGYDAALLRERPQVLGGGKQVGEVRVAF